LIVSLPYAPALPALAWPWSNPRSTTGSRPRFLMPAPLTTGPCSTGASAPRRSPNRYQPLNSFARELTRTGPMSHHTLLTAHTE